MLRKFVIFVVLIASLAMVLDLLVHHYLLERHRNAQMRSVSLQLAAIRVHLEKEIVSSLLLLQGTANLISLNPHLSSQQFDRYASKAMQQSKLLKNIGAAPDLVIAYVYPRQGNQAILGVDYRKLPKQWEQARLAKETGHMVVAGPLKLVQGGVGLIGRAPVYVNTPQGKRFWGLVSAVINMDRLYKTVGLNQLSGLDLAIRGVDGKGAKGAVFFGDPKLFAPAAEAVRMPVSFPSGSWQIAARPKGGWPETFPTAWLLHAIVALLVLGSTLAMYKVMKNRQEVEEAKRSLDEAQAIAHLGNWELQMDDGALWWSDETYRIFGKEKGEFAPSQESFLGLVHPEDRAKVEEAYFASVESGKPYAVDHRIVLPDGTVRHVHEQGVKHFDGGGRHLRSAGTVLDITERKQAEESVRQNYSLLQATLESTADGILVVDLNGHISGYNHKFLDMWKIPPEVAASGQDKKALEYVLDQLQSPQDFLDRVMELYGQPSAESYDVLEFKDNRVFERFSIPQYIDHTPVGRVWSFRDITERVWAEKRLRSSEQRYRTLVDTVPYGIQVTDLEGRIILSNPAHHRIQGIEDGGLVGRYIWDLMATDELRQQAKEYYQAIVRNRPKPKVYYNQDITKDGRRIDVQINWEYLRDASGQVEAILSIISDITERRMAEEENKRLDASLRHAQKMQAVGTLAGGIAHEFNNLLAAIMGYSELICDSAQDRDDIFSDASQIIRASERGRDLVRQLLTFSHKSEPPIKPLNLSLEIPNSKEMLARLIPRNIAIETLLDPDLKQVNMAASHLNQILMNLSTNAAHAMPEGGRLTIKTENILMEPTLCQICGELFSGEYVLLTVADTGQGMDAETLQRVFEPFYSTKEVGAGTGLGLSVLAGLITNYRGHIICTSEVQRGSTFKIYLPAFQTLENQS